MLVSIAAGLDGNQQATPCACHTASCIMCYILMLHVCAAAGFEGSEQHRHPGRLYLAQPVSLLTFFLLLLLQVLMATNRIDILDAALLRPGRIDRKIEFPNPNEGSRFDILKIHSRKMNLMRGIDLKKVADKMPVSPLLHSVTVLHLLAQLA